MKKGTVYFFTGLAGAGKTTIGGLFYRKLLERNPDAVLIDGDQNRLKLGHSAADARPVNMRRPCQEAARICQPAMRAKGLTLSVRAEEGLLWGDAALLQTLLQNLLDNARKAADSGQVVLSGKSTEGGYRVTVADQGRGIPEGELNKITEPFYMVDKSRSRAEGGAGLGLALCKKIAALHGGELRFESREGRGTTVTVELGGVADAQ